MKKNYFLLMALLFVSAFSLTGCSDDEGGTTPPDLDPPVYASSSGKYTVTSSGSSYESIELGGSGNYLITFSNASDYQASAAVREKNSGLGLLNRHQGDTRATQMDNYLYGTYTDKGDGTYELEGFGTITLTTDANGKVTGIEVVSDKYGDATLTVQAVESVASGEMTDALCRTWHVESVRYVSLEFATGEKYEETVDPNVVSDFANEIFFSPAGTYIMKYIDNTFEVERWKWLDQSKGTMVLSFADGHWEDDDIYTISFSGKTATLYEKYEDDECREEVYASMVCD